MPDYSKLSFASDKVIDKVLYESPVLTYSVGAGATSTQTIAHTFNQKLFITLAWSIDGSNYYPAGGYVTMTNTYLANGWADSSNVYLYMENNTAGTLSFRIKYALDTIQ